MRLQPWQMPGWLPGAFDPLLRELPEMQYQFEQPPPAAEQIAATAAWLRRRQPA